MADTRPTATKTATAPTEPTAEDLSAQVDTLRADIAELTRTMQRYAKSQGRQLRTGAQSQIDELSTEAEEYVRQQPATALGIAAAIGFLVGLVMSRR